MKKYLVYLTSVILLAVIISGCKTKDDDGITPPPPPDTPANANFFVNGTLTDRDTGAPLENGVVRIEFDGSVLGTGFSNASGVFSAGAVITAGRLVTVIGFKEGYTADTIEVYAAADRTVDQDFELELSGEIIPETGEAASIHLVSQSADRLGIRETGEAWTAELVFEVRDPQGRPIDVSHSSTVTFSLLPGTFGGAYLFPLSDTTGTGGTVKTTLNTGTLAGVVQVIAEINDGVNILRSKPTVLTIYGGFPVDSLFAVATEKFNHPYLGTIGKEIEFTAYMGDQYSNPVKEGTAVYFSTSYPGIIGDLSAPSSSNSKGQATATYQTFGNPTVPGYGDGFFRVTASTLDENALTITTSTVRLLSGYPIITVTPNTFTLANNGTQTFTITVADANGNPMSQGTSISFVVDGEGLEVSPKDGYELNDEMFSGVGTTIFQATIFDSDTTNTVSVPVSFTVEVAGDNGNKKLPIFGTKQ